MSQAHRVLFGSELDLARVSRDLHEAARVRADAYLRMTLYEPHPGQAVAVTVLRPPVEPDPQPVRLQPVGYVRPFADVKHVGTFAQIRFAELAVEAGFDDALLVTPSGDVAETTIANIVFVAGSDLVWPSAPCLRGVTWQLLDEAVARDGLASRTSPISLDSIERYDHAFVVNSIGITPVGAIGRHRLDVNHALFRRLADMLGRVAWDQL